MLIHELAKTANISVHAIRYYEREGLLDKRHILRQPNGYRVYSANAVERLLLLKQARTAGFTIAEIKKLAEFYDKGILSPKAQVKLLQSKINELNEKITTLQLMKKAFEKKLSSLKK
jgi:DNA-binding transcriptional MerR regulator